MRPHTIICFFLLVCVACTAQPVKFQKVYGGIWTEQGYSVAPTNDGGYIILAGAADSTSYNKTALVKTDYKGDILWAIFYDFDYDYIWGHVQQTADGGYIAASNTYNGFGKSTDIFLLKVKSDGTSEWLKNYGTSWSDEGNWVQEVAGGGYIITGSVKSPIGSDSDALLIRTNPTGDTLWTKSYGGTKSEVGSTVSQTIDGGFIIIGYSGARVYMVKTNSNGDTTWTKTYGGTNNYYSMGGQQTLDGGYILSGGASAVDALLIKTDFDGNMQWSKKYGGASLESYFVSQTKDGGYIMGGKMDWAMRDAFLLKTDMNGDTLWTKSYGEFENDYGWSACEANDGGYVLIGSLYSTSTIGASRDIYLVKTDSLGNSGCNETNISMTADTLTPLLISNPAKISSPKIIVTTPTFSATSGCQVKTLCQFIGINELVNPVVAEISPNPFSSTAILTLSNSPLPAELTIYDVLGNQIRIQTINSEKTTVEKGNLRAGMYFFQINADGIVLTTGKFIAK